jgi:catechol 2,3-dioxygenase-like lactoylglutathione lyase family enzyme
MKFSGITRIVTNVEKSRQFYEEILGFESDTFYEPTRWQSFKVQEDVFFAIGEAPGSTNEVCFIVENIEHFWESIKNEVEVVNPLEKTPWGTYRFVIKDPDGNLLAFGSNQD